MKRRREDTFPILITKGHATVKLYRGQNRGKDHYTLTYLSPTGRKRQFFTDLDAAKREANTRAAMLAAGDLEATKLTGRERQIYVAAAEALAPTGVTLDVAAREFATAFEILGRDGIIEAARFYKRHIETSLPEITVSEAVARVSRGPLRLVAPCLSILWLVQPTLLRELYGTQEAQERGLLARLNVIECGHDAMPLDDGVEREVPSAILEDWNNCIRAALALRNSGRKITFRCEPDAKEVFRAFHNEMVTFRNGEGREHEAKLLRCRENGARIATVIATTEWLAACAHVDNPPLTAEHAAKGVALAQFFLNQSVNLMRGAALERREARLQHVLAIAGQYGGQITIRRLRDHHGVGEVELRQIVERNPALLRIETTKPGTTGGRQSPHLVVLQTPKT